MNNRCGAPQNHSQRAVWSLLGQGENKELIHLPLEKDTRIKAYMYTDVSCPVTIPGLFPFKVSTL